MRSKHTRHRTLKHERLPSVYTFTQRLAVLHELLEESPAGAGDQALKLIEEYLETLAHSYGYDGTGSLGRYTAFLRGQEALPRELLERADGYTQARNCLAHSYGLQTSAEFAAELLDFVALLLKQSAVTAAQLMTSDVCTVADSERLLRVRDLMLIAGYGRLPVLRDGDGIIGLLIERDLVAAQADHQHKSLDQLTVAEALPAKAYTRVAAIAPDTSRDQVVEFLRQPGIIACLVTPGGSLDEAPIGIITHADLLYRMQ